MPSLSSPDGSLPEDDLAFMTLNMEDEMDLRAPYISMSETDDLPLLISDDLMWGAHPETVNLAKELKQSIAKQQQDNSSLVALLTKQQQQQQKQQLKSVDDAPQPLPTTATQIVTTETNDHVVNPLDVMGFKSE